MNMRTFLLILLAFSLFFTACAPVQQDRYNTQRGAAIGAGLGAILGQAIGKNTEGTLLGMAAGTVLGALVGNATDQNYAAARQAASSNQRVVYYDDRGAAVEAIPGPLNQQTNCRKVQKRTWNNGVIVSDTIEEICEGTKTTRDY